MLIIKLLLLVVSPVLLAIGSIWLLGAVLAVDDLKTCKNGPDSSVAHCQPADAIIAISGGDTDARTREAIALYNKGWAPSLILSGAAQDKSGQSNAAAMEGQALRAGVPHEAIILDEQATDTAGNAAGLKPIAQNYRLKRIILVTSPYHQRRASVEFEHVLGKEITIINHPTPEDRFWEPDQWWLNPYSWYLALSETIKLLYVTVANR